MFLLLSLPLSMRLLPPPAVFPSMLLSLSGIASLLTRTCFFVRPSCGSSSNTPRHTTPRRAANPLPYALSTARRKNT